MASARRECVLFFCVGPNLTDGFIFFCSFFFFFFFFLPSRPAGSPTMAETPSGTTQADVRR